MIVTLYVGFFFGVLLSRRYKVLVLVPVSAAAIVVVASLAVAWHLSGLMAASFGFALIGFTQAGYLFGAIASAGYLKAPSVFLRGSSRL